MGHIKNMIGVSPSELRIGEVRINSGVTDAAIDAIKISNTGGEVTNVQIPNSPLVFGKAEVATSGGSTNALNSTRSYIKLTGSTFFNIYGIQTGVDGQQLTVYNGSTNLALFHHNQAVTTNKIYLQNSTPKVLSPGSLATFIYDEDDTGWRCISIDNSQYTFEPTASESNDYTIVYDIYLYQNCSYRVRFPSPGTGDESKTIYAFLHLPELMANGDWIDTTLDMEDTFSYSKSYTITGIYQVGSSDHIIVDRVCSSMYHTAPKAAETDMVPFFGNNIRHNDNSADYTTKLYQLVQVTRGPGNDENGYTCVKKSSRIKLVCSEDYSTWTIDYEELEQIEKEDIFFAPLAEPSTVLNNCRLGCLVYPSSNNGTYTNKGIRFIAPQYGAVNSNRSCASLVPPPATNYAFTVLSGTSEASYPFQVIYLKQYETYYVMFINSSKVMLQSRNAYDDSLIAQVDITMTSTTPYMKFMYYNDVSYDCLVIVSATKIIKFHPEDITDYVVRTAAYTTPRDLAYVEGVVLYAFQGSNIINNNNDSTNIITYNITAPRRLCYIPLTKTLYCTGVSTARIDIIPTHGENNPGGRAYYRDCTDPDEFLYVPKKRMLYVKASTGAYKLDPISCKLTDLSGFSCTAYDGGMGYLPWFNLVFISNTSRTLNYIA